MDCGSGRGTGPARLGIGHLNLGQGQTLKPPFSSVPHWERGPPGPPESPNGVVVPTVTQMPRPIACFHAEACARPPGRVRRPALPVGRF